MSTTIKFSDIQKYLDAILVNWGTNPPPQPPHGVFWRKKGDYADDYNFFTTSYVPGFEKQKISILDQKTPLNSNFYLILLGTLLGKYPQMPNDGPYITDTDYKVTIDSEDLTGDQIQKNIAEWLTNGFPA